MFSNSKTITVPRQRRQKLVKTFIRQVYQVTSSRVGFSKDVDSSGNSSILEFQRHYSVSEFSFDEIFSLINNYYKHAK